MLLGDSERGPGRAEAHQGQAGCTGGATLSFDGPRPVGTRCSSIYSDPSVQFVSIFGKWVRLVIFGGFSPFSVAMAVCHHDIDGQWDR
jgi:hypothetical protein